MSSPNVYDGASGTTGVDTGKPDPQSLMPAPEGGWPAPGDPGQANGVADDPMSLLDQLAEQIEDAEEHETDTTTVDLPGDLGWRLVCDITFSYDTYSKWQKASLPKGQRNGRRMNPLDMDQATLALLVLSNTCVGLEYRTSGGDWRPLREPDGDQVTLESSWLLGRFNVMDPKTMLRRLFGKREAPLVAAGMKVVDDAGWSADGADPTS